VDTQATGELMEEDSRMEVDDGVMIHNN